MERLAVKSTEIAIVGYDRPSQKLEITFRKGGVYLYDGVPEAIHQELLNAPSIGTYFTQKIKDQYACTKVH